MHHSPEQAYRWSVVPLGIFMLFGGIILFIAALFFPSESIFLPPFQTPWGKRLIFAGISLCFVPLGIGFLLRSKLAWQGFFVILLLGTIWHVIIALLDSQFFPLVVSPLFNIPLAIGIYLATKPAFTIQPTSRLGVGEKNE